MREGREALRVMYTKAGKMSDPTTKVSLEDAIVFVGECQVKYQSDALVAWSYFCYLIKILNRICAQNLSGMKESFKRDCMSLKRLVYVIIFLFIVFVFDSD